MGFWDAVALAGPYANNLHLAPDREREREKFINHKQINNVTVKIINSCGSLPARKIPSS